MPSRDHTRPREQRRASPRAAKNAIGLRKAMSMPERVLWNILKHQREGGLTFRQQHPIGPYVLDFYCHAAELVIEIDSATFHRGSQVQRDQVRDAWMAERGLVVLRIGAWRLPRQRYEIAEYICGLAREMIEAKKKAK